MPAISLEFMCGRFFLSQNLDVLKREFSIKEVSYPYNPSYNIAPTQQVAVVVREQENSENTLTSMRWGLIPSWAKDEKIGARMINARAETIAEKPSFRQALLQRRCLILADGFFEWGVNPGKKEKQPFAIRLRSRKTFAFAGLWDHRMRGDGKEISGCTIITTEANSLIQRLHARMPLILQKSYEDAWLAKETPPEKLMGFLERYPFNEMEMYPVTERVGSTKYNEPDCIIPANN